MPQIARNNDRTTGTCVDHGVQTGVIQASATSSFCNEKKIARVGDTVKADCGCTGVIIDNDANVICEGKKIARVDDSFEGAYTGNIVEGSPNVYNKGN